MTLNERLIWAATFAHVMDKYESGSGVLAVVHEACWRAEFNVENFRRAAKDEIERIALGLPPSGIPKRAADMLKEMAEPVKA